MRTTRQRVRADEGAAPIMELLAERWSPRSYDPTATVSEELLDILLEAARWSPSAGNSQPWRFVVARRGTAAFDRIVANLTGLNSAWTPNASALILNCYEAQDEMGEQRKWAAYDLGQSVAHLSIEAHHQGLHVHQMGGLDPDGMSKAFGLDPQWIPLTVIAIGVIAPAAELGVDILVERENAARGRLPVEQIVKRPI
jgi:nitroreductase